MTEHGNGTCDNCQIEAEIESVLLCDCGQSIQLCANCDSIPEIFCECGKQIMPKSTMNAEHHWKLNRVDSTEYKPDDTGIYVLINWDIKTNTVRLDFMSRKHESIQSFAGSSDNVRKHAMRYIHEMSRVNWPNSGYDISLEHAAYIGSELQLADVMRIDYIQDGTFRQTSYNTALTDSELIEKTERDNKQKADNLNQRFENRHQQHRPITQGGGNAR